MVAPRESISEKNKYRFVCPVTQREVFYAECLKGVQDYKCGKHSALPECNACMASSKCPAEYMWVEEFKKKEAQHYSESEKVGKCPDAIIQKVAVIAVMDSYCDRFAVSQGRRAVIGATKIGDSGWYHPYGEPKLSGVADKPVKYERPKVMPQPKRDYTSKPVEDKKPEKPKKKDDFGANDYAAVVNKMIETETKSSEPSDSSSMSLLELARLRKKG